MDPARYNTGSSTVYFLCKQYAKNMQSETLKWVYCALLYNLISCGIKTISAYYKYYKEVTKSVQK